jgi:hypothetical protein
MTRLSLLTFILLSLIFLVLLSPYIGSPVLYTIEMDATTSFHTNPKALILLSQEKTGELTSLMQELLDAPEPIMLNLKINDFEEAEYAFAEYQEKSRYFDNFVVTLELTDSAVGGFQRENRKNIVALEQMINESARLEELNRLEIQYRSEDNPSLLYTVTYEGEAVQQFLSESTGGYHERSTTILEISEKLGLNTEKFEESVGIANEIATARKQEQQERRDFIPSLTQNTLNLAVTPESGIYGDSLTIAGTLISSEQKPITLYLDSQEWKTLLTDENGIFRTSFTIVKFRSGTHFIYAQSGLLYSPIVSFNVLQTDSFITLDVERRDGWDEFLCTGTLTSPTIPVSGAPIMLLVNGFTNDIVITTGNGTFASRLVLPEGSHAIQAVFDDPAFPLPSSESQIERVSVSPAGNLFFNIAVGAGFIFLSSLGAVYYLRRFGKSQQKTISPTPEPEYQPEVSGNEYLSPSLPESSTGDAIEAYEILKNKGDWSNAVHALYQHLLERLAIHFAIPHPLCLTPRELSAALAEDPISPALSSYVSQYEQIRYGGGHPVQAEEDTFLITWRAVLAVLEETQ